MEVIGKDNTRHSEEGLSHIGRCHSTSCVQGGGTVYTRCDGCRVESVWLIRERHDNMAVLVVV